MTPPTADLAQEISDVSETNATVMNGLFDDPAESHQPVARPTTEVQAILESLLFVSPDPIPIARLVSILEDVTKAEVDAALTSLEQSLEQEGRGVRLAKVAGGYRLVTKHEYAPWVKRLDKTKTVAKLSRSALESLAIIAYKQPLVRAEIEEIRGVETAGVIRTLLERKLVRIVGRKEVPGRPIMYGTTKFFLEHFGLHDLSQLPPLREFKELGDSEQSLVATDGEEIVSRATSTESTDGHTGESWSSDLNGSMQSAEAHDSRHSIDEAEGISRVESTESAHNHSEESEGALDELIDSIQPESSETFVSLQQRDMEEVSAQTPSVESSEGPHEEPVSGELNGFHPQG